MNKVRLSFWYVKPVVPLMDFASGSNWPFEEKGKLPVKAVSPVKFSVKYQPKPAAAAITPPLYEDESSFQVIKTLSESEICLFIVTTPVVSEKEYSLELSGNPFM